MDLNLVPLEHPAQGKRTHSLGNDGAGVVVTHNMLRPNHHVVASLDGLSVREVDSIFLHNLFNVGLGWASAA